MSHLLPSSSSSSTYKQDCATEGASLRFSTRGEPGWRVAAEGAGHCQSAEPRARAQGDKVTSWGFLLVPQVAAWGPSKSGCRRAHTGSRRSLCGATRRPGLHARFRGAAPTHPVGSSAVAPGFPPQPSGESSGTSLATNPNCA
ncbi:hypothetical protein PAL_GLEAN10020701 [Pteropus alecto]|uniref:Uncharacterized protein n=1 Tax=Pteropus alecto TaxID=9402 RepID=L5JSD5_PTEAL|nr:hypothetical protein PAL_GLEAN10020701 [Pteropus alecto]